MRRLFRFLFRRPIVEGELDAELRFHVEEMTRDGIAHGMSPATAGRAARLSFGGLEQIKDDCRDVRPTRIIEELGQDLRFTARILRKRPGFVAVVLLMLGIGIGVSTAMFTVVHTVLVAPLPYPQPDRMVLFRQGLDGGEHFSVPDCVDYRGLTRTFEAITCIDRYTDLAFNLTADGRPRRAVALPVSSDFFDVLGIPPHLGRKFTRAEERPDARVAIISHHLWREIFAGRPDAISRQVALDGVPYTVVGILPEDYPALIEGPIDLWLPQNLAPGDRNQRNNSYVTIFGRLRTGATIAQAQAELSTIDAALARQYPATNRRTSARISPYNEALVSHARRLLIILMAAAGLVLLVASFNVANLLLLRIKTRAPEFCLRIALGAGRGRIARQMITEHAVFAIVGGVVGLGLAWGITRILLALRPSGLPRIESLSLNSAAFVFGLIVTTAAGLLFGALPKLQRSAQSIADVVRYGGRSIGETAGRHHARDLFVVAQIAIATVLLVGTSLLSASLLNLLHVDLGYSSRNVVSFQVHLPEGQYPSTDSLIAFRRTLTERLETHPGVRAAGYTSRLPLTGDYNMWGFEMVGSPPGQSDRPAPLANFRGVGGHYFRALEIGLVTGRIFDERDHASAPPVAIVSEKLARRFWPDGKVGGGAVRVADRTWTVVGVVRDTLSDLHASAPPTAYIPFDQYPRRRWSIVHVVSTAGRVPDLADRIRATLRALDPNLVPYDIDRLDRLETKDAAQSQFALIVMATFAATALLLSLVGVYGVVSYSVATRSHEIGVRIALGASRPRIVSLFLTRGAYLSLAGIISGLATAYATARVMSSILFGVAATSPTAFGAAGVVLVGTTLIACFLPARRGSRLEPHVALRQE